MATDRYTPLNKVVLTGPKIINEPIISEPLPTEDITDDESESPVEPDELEELENLDHNEITFN
ncbi:MAG: hypothetical protein GX790_08875 [Syntrophomonadaceae bacterium]|nr:hypothetical protein [Syntrophomonadaceae bacterium]